MTYQVSEVTAVWKVCSKQWLSYRQQHNQFYAVFSCGKVIIQPSVSCFLIYKVEMIISFYVEVFILLFVSKREKVSSKQLK